MTRGAIIDGGIGGLAAARARGQSNHLSSLLAAIRRDGTIALRRRLGRGDLEGRGAAWIPSYDAGSPDALAV